MSQTRTDTDTRTKEYLQILNMLRNQSSAAIKHDDAWMFDDYFDQDYARAWRFINEALYDPLILEKEDDSGQLLAKFDAKVCEIETAIKCLASDLAAVLLS